MANVTTQSVVRQIESLYGGGSIAGLTDRQLVERFVTRRDSAGEDAFAALVARHGPMVLRVCRALLGDRQHAEDAFQAVFLVLARKARSVRNPDLLGNWLYGIALRTARKARARLARQTTEELRAVIHSEASTTMTAEQVAMSREQVETLHAEIERLPGLFRAPVVLCYFEGLTLDQAAVLLRCPAGTIHSRLVRARNRLRRGLIRRGLSLSATGLVASLSSQSASASVSSQLCAAAARAAIKFAAGHTAAPLAAEVLRSMAFQKLKLVALSVLLLGVVATSAGYVTHALARNDSPNGMAAAPDDAKGRPAAGRMFVTGRVLDPQGKPVAGARVAAAVRVKFSEISTGLERPVLSEIGHVDADGSGRFRVDAPRTSSSRNDAFVAIAMAPGYGAGWAKIDPDADRPAADITLEPEQVIQGRLFDVQGRPAQRVAVSVSSIERQVGQETGRPIVNRLFEGVVFEWTRVNEIPAWPKPATTDTEGRFTIQGIGRGLKAGLSIIDSRFALDNIDVETDGAPGAKLVTATLEPAKIFTGRVSDAETGKPVPHAQLQFMANASDAQRRFFRQTRFQADADGRFRANPSPGESYVIRANSPAGKIYVETQKEVNWSKGAVEQSLDLTLNRGAAIRGKVVEEGSTLPIAGASVAFMTLSRADVNRPGWQSATVTRADGSFELAVVARIGHLAVQAPSEDYILHQTGLREITWNQPGGTPVYSSWIVACDPKLSGPGLEFQIVLRRGAAVTGRIVGPDDRPVPDAWIIGRAALPPSFRAWRPWLGSYHGQAQSGRFELHGFDADTDVAVFFLEPKGKLGAVAHLSGKSASEGPVNIRLDPCGAATARLVDSHGRPLADYREMSLIRLVISPGPEYRSRDPEEMKRMSAEAEFQYRVDPINYFKPPVSDKTGRIAFPALIPGATYRISDWTTLENDKGAIGLRKEFAVRPGQTVDLGDILVEKPRKQPGG